MSLSTLTSGPGFSAVTPQPSTVGSGDGVDAKAIAKWDAVPYQTVTGQLQVGVVAFHKAGIDRVEFSLNGGPLVSVHEMTQNPATSVYEYNANIDATALPDGLHEVQAVVYPRVGIPRVLGGSIDGSLAYKNGNHSMFLSANSHGTLPQRTVYCSLTTGSDLTGDGTQLRPYKTPAFAIGNSSKLFSEADGLTVYCMPGNYAMEPSTLRVVAKARWVRIAPAPGVAKSEVVFDTSVAGGFKTRLLCLDGVTVKGAIILQSTTQDYLWGKNCDLIGPGADVNSGFFYTTVWAGTYFTDCDVSKTRNGIRSATYIRGCYTHETSGSPYGDATMVVNSRCDTYVDFGFHGDVFHWFQENNDVENVIGYGIDAKSFNNQGIYAAIAPVSKSNRMDNVALVNVHISKDVIPSTVSGSWWERSTNHFLLLGVSMPDQVLRLNQIAKGTTLQNVLIDGLIVKAISLSPLPADSIVRHAHYTDPAYYQGMYPGTDVTKGDAGFTDVAALDYTPSATSPLLGRVSLAEFRIPTDVRGNLRAAMTAIGPYAGSLEFSGGTPTPTPTPVPEPTPTPTPVPEPTPTPTPVPEPTPTPTPTPVPEPTPTPTPEPTPTPTPTPTPDPTDLAPLLAKLIAEHDAVLKVRAAITEVAYVLLGCEGAEVRLTTKTEIAAAMEILTTKRTRLEDLRRAVELEFQHHPEVIA